jgi:hypothetical protein
LGSLASPLPMRWECQPCIARAAASLRARPDPEPGVPPAFGYKNTKESFIQCLCLRNQHYMF